MFGNKILNILRGKGNGTVSVNGQTYSGNNVSIINNRVWIDGVEQTDNTLPSTGIIQVTVNGDVEKVETLSGDITVTGNTGAVSTSSGDVEIEGSAQGSVTTMSGDVRVRGSIGGSVSTMSGDISR